MIRIEDLKEHKDVVIDYLKNAPKMINNIFEEAEKIRNQSYSNFCKEHSDILDLLDKHMLKDKDGIQKESFYECLERILKELQDFKKERK